MDWLRRRRSEGREPIEEHEEWLATAEAYARHLTETGSRCHLNKGRTRFCHWTASVLDGEGDPSPVGVRCTIHPGGRYLDSTARLAPEDYA